MRHGLDGVCRRAKRSSSMQEDDVRYRTMGTTSLEISEIGFGTGDNAGALVLGDPEAQRAIIERALALGVNYFDTSPDYGRGLAEANLGRILRELRANDALVATKVEIMPEQLGRIPETIIDSVEASLLRLRRDRVDVLMVHNPCRPARAAQVRKWTPLTPADILDLAVPALERLRAAGKARYLGLACEHAATASLTDVLASGLFAMTNVWFNLVNPTAGMPPGALARGEARLPPQTMPPTEGPGAALDDYSGMIDAAVSAGAGVAVIRPLAGGALSRAVAEHGHSGRHPLAGGAFSRQPALFEPELVRARRLLFLDRPGDQTIVQAAYRFLLADPRITTVIGGFSEVAHLDDAISVIDAGPMSETDMVGIQRVYLDDYGVAAVTS